MYIFSSQWGSLRSQEEEAMAEEQRKAQELQDGSPPWEWGFGCARLLGWNCG